MTQARPRVLALAMDAAEAAFVMPWAQEGKLPVLGRLLHEGSSVALRTNGDLLPESVWSTIVSGTSLATHGIYSWRVIEPGTHSLRWSPNGALTPFWRTLVEHGEGERALLVDIPYTAPLGHDRVTEVIGWGQRGTSLQASWPPSLLDHVHRRYGSYPDWTHHHYHRHGPGQRRLLRNLERLAAVRTRLLADLVREQAWTLCVACYAEPHNAGHEFCRYLQPGTWGHDQRQARGVSDGLLRSYRAIDRGIGEVIEAAGDPLNVLIFSGTGMRPNTAPDALLRKVLIKLGYQVPAAQPARPQPLHALRERVPWSVRRLLHLRLSQPTRERLMERIWLDATDWGATRAYAEEEPGVGLVHINVRGRDPQGIVEPGAPYRALCDELAGELRSLTDAESGAPAVVEVLHRDDLAEGPRSHYLPDLTVRWASERMLRAVRHPRAGLIQVPTRDTPYVEHSGEGFVIAAGPSIRADARLEGRAEDIAPTLLSLRGVPVPGEMDGTPLTDLALRPAARPSL